MTEFVLNNHNQQQQQQEFNSRSSKRSTNNKTRDLNINSKLFDLNSSQVFSSALSKPMIVNSHPFKPSQQRCVDLHSLEHEQQQQQQQESRMQQQQQNSLYGSTSIAFSNNNNNNNSSQSQHMLDLANLQQNMLFSSTTNAQDTTTSGYECNVNNNNNNSKQLESNRRQEQIMKRFGANNTNNNAIDNTNNTNTFAHQLRKQQQLQQQQQQQQKTQVNVDQSLHSPSSSTSLLYHIYDQINLPNEHHYQQSNQHHQQQQQQQSHDSGILLASSNGSASSSSTTSGVDLHSSGTKKSNTTVLNPANLFGGLNNQPAPNSLHLPLSMQVHLQQQQQQQHCYSAQNPYLFQQQQHHHPFNTIHHQSAFQQQQQQQQPMFESVLRQHALNSTLARTQHNHRPLSSSAGSSSIDSSGANCLPQPLIGYGRHPRLQQTKSNNSTNSSITGNNNNNINSTTLGHQLNHLALMGSSPTLNTLIKPMKPTNLDSTPTSTTTRRATNNNNTNNTPTAAAASSSLFNDSNALKRAHRRLSQLVYEYRTIVKCSILLVLLAFSLMSIIKFTLSSASSQQQQHQLYQAPLLSKQHNHQHNFNNNNELNHQTANSNHHHAYHQQQQPTASNINLNTNNMMMNYPFTRPDQAQQQPNSVSGPMIIPHESGASSVDPFQTNEELQQQQPQQDYLKSRLLIGEFAIISQNYSQSASHNSLLGERILKLMDQVFLSTEMRRYYSRMEVHNIKPNKPSGIIVECTIVLSESISWAAQQFGKALFDALVLSNERLASQANYIIDKNSIKFSSVPDNDLKSGLFPPSFMPTLSRSDLMMIANNNNKQPAIESPSFGKPPIEPSSVGQMDPIDQLNSVVWSEWSQWSSCVGKSGVCDPTRLHSRIRKCVGQHTGEKVDAVECKQRFNMQDQELEVADCSRTCNQQQPQLSTNNEESPIRLSDTQNNNNNNGPHTAPSVMVSEMPHSMMGSNGEGLHQVISLPSFLQSPKVASQVPMQQPQTLAVTSSGNNLNSQQPTAQLSGAKESLVAGGESTPASIVSSTTERINSQQMVSTEDIGTNNSPSSGGGGVATPTLMPIISGEQQQPPMSCSNCTSDEICLLLMSQKVPFCAKIKDRSDESGCGGWCKVHNQLCQPVGQNAFKCIHDSECLPEEWRCHDSACIPFSKRCDGHSNCYDSSDERDCPVSSL